MRSRRNLQGERVATLCCNDPSARNTRQGRDAIHRRNDLPIDSNLRNGVVETEYLPGHARTEFASVGGCEREVQAGEIGGQSAAVENGEAGAAERHARVEDTRSGSIGID